MSKTDKQFRRNIKLGVVIILLLFAIVCVVTYKTTPQKYCIRNPYGNDVSCTENLTKFNEWRQIYLGGAE